MSRSMRADFSVSSARTMLPPRPMGLSTPSPPEAPGVVGTLSRSRRLRALISSSMGNTTVRSSSDISCACCMLASSSLETEFRLLLRNRPKRPLLESCCTSFAFSWCRLSRCLRSSALLLNHRSRCFSSTSSSLRSAASLRAKRRSLSTCPSMACLSMDRRESDSESARDAGVPLLNSSPLCSSSGAPSADGSGVNGDAGTASEDCSLPWRTGTLRLPRGVPSDPLSVPGLSILCALLLMLLLLLLPVVVVVVVSLLLPSSSSTGAPLASSVALISMVNSLLLLLLLLMMMCVGVMLERVCVQLLCWQHMSAVKIAGIVLWLAGADSS
eukprot:m.183318 g.183318  ORF g.183318 m.183318 type:complete len:328 (+) comp17474_c0_seq1:2540-3523(+)